MAIEIVDFPIKNGGSFNSYVKLPEGNINLPRLLVHYCWLYPLLTTNSNNINNQQPLSSII